MQKLLERLETTADIMPSSLLCNPCCLSSNLKNEKSDVFGKVGVSSNLCYIEIFTAPFLRKFSVFNYFFYDKTEEAFDTILVLIAFEEPRVLINNACVL